MSHSTNAKMNKYQKHPKVNYDQYLYNSGEPEDDGLQYELPELEAELISTSSSMRRRFRRTAQKMRMRYS